MVLTAWAFLVQSVLFSQTPPSPPPGSYVRISIEKTAEQFQRNADTCLLKITLRETFNIPIVRTIRFGFLGPDSVSTVRPIRLIEDRNGNGREDGADTLICAAAAQAGDSFSFDAIDAGLSAETVWLVCGGFSTSGNPLAKVRVEFKPDAFGGPDTFFDFPGFDSGEILVNVEERNPRAEAPETFRLLQNFPNPFNPRTHFRLALPKQGRVRFSVFNILGQEVAVLLDRDLAAGWHPVEWDGNDGNGRPLPTGVYIGLAQFGGMRAVVKLQMVK